MGSRRSSKRNRKVSERMAVVDDADRQHAQQARLDALEDGVGEDALAVDDDDDEFDIEDELEVEVTARGKTKKRKSAGKKKARRFNARAAVKDFRVLLEESGVYEGKLPEPHYLSAETGPPRAAARRAFCQVCGNFSRYKCARCLEPFCSTRCCNTHNELRCLKFAI